MRILIALIVTLFMSQSIAQEAKIEYLNNRILSEVSISLSKSSHLFYNQSQLEIIFHANDLIEKMKMKRNEEFLLSKKIERTFFYGGAIGDIKTHYHYDSHFRKITELIHNSVGNDFKRNIYSYNNSDQLIKLEEQRKDQETWFTRSVYEYSYNENGLLLESLLEYSNGERHKTIYTYDEFGNKINENLFFWNENITDWVTSNYSVYEYDENNYLQKVYKYIEVGDHPTISEYYFYDDDYKLTQITSHDSRHANYYRTDISKFMYDDRDRIIEALYSSSFSSTSGSWEIVFRTFYSYDNNNNLVVAITRGEDNRKITYSYMENRLIKKELYSLKNDGSKDRLNKQFLYNYKLASEINLDTVRYSFNFELPNDTVSYPLHEQVIIEGSSYYFEPISLQDPYLKYNKFLNIFNGARFILDEDAINEDVSLDIRFEGLANDGSIVNPLDNTPLFMFLGIEVTGEQSGVTDFEDFYYFNEGKKARIIIPRTEKFLAVLEELEIDETNLSFAYVKGGEYFDEGLEWEIKEGEEGKVDSLCLYLDHFSQIVGGKNLLTSVEQEEENLPTQFSLEQNFPNPFNPVTTINYSIPSNVFTSIRLNVFDILGSKVKTLVNEPKAAGRHSVSFDGSNLSSGVYYYQLKAGSFVETKKMVFIK